VGPRVETAPIVVENEGRNDLDHEEHVLHRPAEDEGVDQGLSRQGRRQADSPPDADASDCAVDYRHENKKPGVIVQIIKIRLVTGTVGMARLNRQKEATTYGIVRHDDVQHRYDGDEHRRREKRDIPPRVMHSHLLVPAAMMMGLQLRASEPL
jgi:hypothetical protein